MARRSRWAVLAGVVLVATLAVGGPGPAGPALGQTCSAAYPDFCIPPPPPDLDCGSPAIADRKNFTALAPDPHGLDNGGVAGLACEDPSRPRYPTTTTSTTTPTTTAAGPANQTGIISITPAPPTTLPPASAGVATGLLERTG